MCVCVWAFAHVRVLNDVVHVCAPLVWFNSLWFGSASCYSESQLPATAEQTLHSYGRLQSDCILPNVNAFLLLSLCPPPAHVSVSVCCLPVSWSVYLSVCPLSPLPNSGFFLTCRTLLVSLLFMYPSFLCTLLPFSLCPVLSGHFKLNIDRTIYLPAVPGRFKYWHHVGVSTRTRPGHCEVAGVERKGTEREREKGG